MGLIGVARASLTAGGDFASGLTALLQAATLVAIGINGLDLDIGPIHLNSERILMPFVAVGLLICVALDRRFFFQWPSLFYLGWAGSVVLSALASGAFLAHVNGLLVSVAPFVYFFLFTQRGLSRTGLRLATEAFLWIVALACIAVYLAWYASGAFETAIDRGRIALTMVEPNILGGTLAAIMVIHLAFFRFGVRHVALHLLAIVALLLTASKAPYAAYALGLLYYLFRSGRLRGPTALALAATGLVLAPLVGIVFAGSLYDFYVLALDRPDAINNRTYALVIGWQRFLEHPILGNGPLDFALQNQSILALMGTDEARNMWIWQIWVALLHDEGLVGFALFLAMLAAAWRWAGAMARPSPGRGNRDSLAFQAALLVILVGSQFTTAHLSAIFGLIVGLVSAPPIRDAVPGRGRRPARRPGLTPAARPA